MAVPLYSSQAAKSTVNNFLTNLFRGKTPQPIFARGSATAQHPTCKTACEKIFLNLKSLLKKAFVRCSTLFERINHMKTRIISGVSYSLIIIAVMFFMNTAALPILMAFICGVAVYELNHVAKVKLPLAIPSIIVGAYIPIEIRYHFLEKIHVTPFAALAVYIIAMLIIMVKWHGEVKFEQVAISVLCSIAVPESLGCWVRINDLQLIDERYTQENVVYLILFTLFCAWLTDMFAYFTGVFFGKHKMTPVVSPKKTWEGAIGGVVLTATLNVGLYFVFAKKFFPDGSFFLWDWWAVIPISLVLSVISIFGDLSASVIKRNYGVKDYGKLIPGHGGIMDRFDSTLFVFPIMYGILSIIETF